MDKYVKGRAASPQAGQQPQKTRAQMGADARVSMGGAPLTLVRANHQHMAARRQSANNANQSNVQQQRRANEGQNIKRDPYDTDAESLDTTTQRGSHIQVADSQLPGQDPYVHEEVEEQSNSDDYTDVIVEEGDEEEGEEQDQQNNSHVWYQGDHKAGAFPGDGNSYPSTTSGPDEDFFNNMNADQELLSDRMAHPDEVSPSLRSVKQSALFPPPTPQPFHQQASKRVPNQTTAKPTMAKIDYFQQGVTLRQQDRSNANVAVRGTGGHQNPAHPLGSYNQANREIVQLGFLDPRQIANTQGGNLSQRGPRAPVGLSYYQPVAKSVEQGVLTTRGAPSWAKQEPIGHCEIVEQVMIEDDESKPITEDYDKPALFYMAYDKLKNESFDHMPRGKFPVLSPDLESQPIEQRLEHASKELGAENQFKFFQSLPTNEWEEAGDWFLGRFEDIIKRTRQARQSKRKLAQGYENEIEQRYRHVAKRQQHVQDALGQMNVQGQGLIPKSPRASKEPSHAPK